MRLKLREDSGDGKKYRMEIYLGNGTVGFWRGGGDKVGIKMTGRLMT